MTEVVGLKTGVEDCAPFPGAAASTIAARNPKPARRFPNKVDIRTPSRSSNADNPQRQRSNADGAPQQATHRYPSAEHRRRRR